MQLDENDLPSDVRFGRVFAAIFAAVGIYFGLTGWMPGLVGGLVIGGAFGALAQLRPGLLAPMNRAWAMLGLVLGKIVGTFVLGVIFVTILTPISLVFKIIGRDELRLRPGQGATYWRGRDISETRSSFRDQF